MIRSLHRAGREQAQSCATAETLRAAIRYADEHPARDNSLSAAAAAHYYRHRRQLRATVARYIAHFNRQTPTV